MSTNGPSSGIKFEEKIEITSRSGQLGQNESDIEAFAHKKSKENKSDGKVFLGY